MSSKNPTAQARSLPALRALIELPRPINGLITFASVSLAGWLGAQALTFPLLLAATSAALITGGGNALNDLCGLTEDRINKPHRPLPSGRLSVRLARVETVLLLLSGLALSIPLPKFAQATALLAVLLLLLYNIRLKRVPLLGNITVSALGSLAFLYGGFAVRIPHPTLLPAVFAFLFHLGREILKDLEDCTGDQLLTGSTIPLYWGPQTARRLITAILGLLILLMPLPALLGPYGLPYLTPILFLTGLLLYVLRALRTAQAPELSRLSRLLKFGMLLGLSAFFFDRI